MICAVVVEPTDSIVIIVVYFVVVVNVADLTVA